MLIAQQQASNEFADLRPDKDLRETMRQNRAAMIDRARKLKRMGLATEVTPGMWAISSRAEPILRELGTRGDIIKTMHQALEREGIASQRDPARYVLHREQVSERITGRVLSKGLGGDELSERVSLTIDGVDGRVHHVELDAARAEEVGRGMIVAIGTAPVPPRASDRNILDIAGEHGIYRPSAHLEQARANIERLGGDPAAFVRSHVRRLEALRRAGHVERLDDDHWRVPRDLGERGLSYDLSREGAGTRVTVLSPITLDKQVGHDGATWLDRELTSTNRTPHTEAGFGRDVAVAGAPQAGARGDGPRHRPWQR